MSNSLRNKLALVLFFLLFLLGGALLALYIFLGHSWNFAATEIDVGSGHMSKYMVIVLEGQTPPAKSASLTEGATSDSTASSTSAEAANTNTSVGSNTNANAENTGGTGIRATIQRFFNWDTTQDASEEEVDEAKESAVFSDVTKVKDLGDAYANYSIKGADVLPLSSSNLAHYAQGEIYIKGDYKIGVLSLTEVESYKIIQQKIDELYARGANLIVVLTTHSGVLAFTQGVDVCVVLDGKTQVLETAVEDSRLTVKTGVKGSINAIIFSPNHVITAKTL